MKIVFLDVCGDKTTIRSDVRMVTIDGNLFSLDNEDGSLLLAQYNKHRDIELLEHEYDYRLGDDEIEQINKLTKASFIKLLLDEQKQELVNLAKKLKNFLLQNNLKN